MPLDVRRRHDVVATLDFGTWTDAVDREFGFPMDRLVVGLADDERIRRLVVVDPWRSGPRQLARRLTGKRRHPPPPGVTLVRPQRLRTADPTTTDDLRRSYAAYGRRVGAAVGRAGLNRPIVITSNPFYAAYGDFAWAASVTYYGWDDFAAWAPLAPWREALLDAYRAIASGGVRVVAVSRAIIDRIAPSARALVVPNGLEPSEWERVGPAPDWLAGVAHPILLYIGSIGHRLDLDVLEAVARRFPDATLLLVGLVVDPEVLGPLRRVPNVRLEGQIPRSAVPGLVHAADVCVLPHVRTSLTEAMSPLKVYEYLAAGRPVVATDLEPVRGIDERVLLVPAGDPGGFADAVSRAMEMGPATERRRLAFLEANTWTRRRELILGVALGPAG